MSEQIKHECGLAFIRLKKPLEFYHKKYGSALYGLEKMQLLMQKQRNRGQDGAGLATLKLDMPPGSRYISRKRNNTSQYIKGLFNDVHLHFKDLSEEQKNDPNWLKANKPYTGEILLGHLRYGTHGKNTIETCHPFLRQNNWITRNLILAGNFNLTNVKELFDELISFGQHPKEESDTTTILEKIGHFLDDEVQRLFSWFKPEGYSNEEITSLIAQNMDVGRVLQRASRRFDGGYVLAGIIGHGDSFVMRDPSGIRPAFYYADDEIVVAASERPAIQTVIDVRLSEIKELQRGHALIIKKNGEVNEQLIKYQMERKACSFERIYFSRGTDLDIYNERKTLGKMLVKTILESVDHNFEKTIFSFIPNTAEVAFYGMMEGIQEELDEIKKKKLLALGADIDESKLKAIMDMKARFEKVAVKDAKMRTFIADDKSREGLISHVYDVTYGLVDNEKDTLVMIDDSIVRGSTLQTSILQILSRLHPKKIIIVSSAPQIRYPDCYGIDMSKMGDFVAFKALVALLEETGQEEELEKTYWKCKEEIVKPIEEIDNAVKALYSMFTYEEVSNKIAEIITPKNIKPEVEIIYQTVENLRKACPNNNGDWYFSGDYPTPGGNKVVNIAFINYFEKKDVRAYT